MILSLEQFVCYIIPSLLLLPSSPFQSFLLGGVTKLCCSIIIALGYVFQDFCSFCISCTSECFSSYSRWCWWTHLNFKSVLFSEHYICIMCIYVLCMCIYIQYIFILFPGNNRYFLTFSHQIPGTYVPLPSIIL